MSEFVQLIEEIRSRLVWRKDQQEWLPSMGSGETRIFGKSSVYQYDFKVGLCRGRGLRAK
jgi:hypothetical protein